MRYSSKHIVILPLNAQGHLISILTLANELEQRSNNFTITIATTPLNTQYMQHSTIFDKSNNNIRLAVLPFNCSDHGLPPNIENTDALPLPQAGLLFHALLTSLQTPFHSLISSIIAKEGHPPLCIISDLSFGWAVEVAKTLGTLSITFCPVSAFGGAAYTSFWQNLPHRYGDESYTIPDKYRFQCMDLLPFVKDVEEMEGLGMGILREYVKIPIWAIDPILPRSMLISSHNNSSSSTRSISKTIYGHHGLKENKIFPTECIEWLDLHSQSSVIYISFGSQFNITTSPMIESAKGLEESGHPFIWVLKPFIDFDPKKEFKAAEWCFLPKGFKEKMAKSGQGLLVHGWAPQLEILLHKSIGAFLSHCGWNSVLESLSQGVPIIGWPIAAEQVYNSRFLMEEMGVCVELGRGLKNVVVGKEVKRIIDLVMDSNGKGREMKKMLQGVVEKMREAVRSDEENGHKGKAMDGFIDTILSSSSQQTK